MGQTVEGKTIEQSLLDAYKAQLSTYDALLSVKDAQVAFLEAQIKGLKLELEQYKNTEVKPQSSTGLTAKEREDIAKLSKEIMDQPLEEDECFEEMTIEFNLEDFNKRLRKALTRAFVIAVESKENTTTANSDAPGISRETFDKLST